MKERLRALDPEILEMGERRLDHLEEGDVSDLLLMEHELRRKLLPGLLMVGSNGIL
jgi:hypothetical protein